MRTPFKTRTEYNYKMMIAGKERVVENITLVQLPETDRWSISVKESKRVFKEVAQKIISSQDNLLFEEVEFLRNLYRLSFDELGECLNWALEEVVKFRKTQGILDKDNSLKIKNLIKSKQLT